MTRYLKSIVAVLSAVLVTVLAQFPENGGVQQWGPIVAAFLGAIGVYLVPNTPTPVEPAPATVTPLPPTP